MACVVSIKETCIIDGRLLHQDIKTVWSNYDVSLHKWMLNLTEEFDLTFPVEDKDMNIVPCLLPEKEPQYEWPELTSSHLNKIKEFKVVYNFNYLPSGLFNRIQVRLYQYGDSSLIWKNGSLLRKNNHVALITQTKEKTIVIKVNGVKPENLIYLIHEVIETLAQQSFHGIQYDFSFPCPDCVDSQVAEPCLFDSTLLRRANDLKAPFLQCNKLFHAISIQEMMNTMPIDSNLDSNLEHSLRDLKQIQQHFKYDIAFWYCEDDSNNGKDSVDPVKVVEVMKKENYETWYSKDPKNEKFDKITTALKESKIVILGLSDKFAANEKCVQVFDMVKNLIKKNYLIIEFGLSHDWLENPKFASVCGDCRVIMQDQKRYSHKLTELFDTVERRVKQKNTKENKKNKQVDVFISYCWSNSQEAVKKGTKATKTSLGMIDCLNYFIAG